MNILVLCMGNTCRSPMAMALLRQARPGWKVESAGIWPDCKDLKAADHAIKLFPELAQHESRKVTTDMCKGRDMIVILSRRLVLDFDFDLDSKVLDEIPLVTLNILDPKGGKLHHYEACVAHMRRVFKKCGLLPLD